MMANSSLLTQSANTLLWYVRPVMVPNDVVLMMYVLKVPLNVMFVQDNETNSWKRQHKILQTLFKRFENYTADHNLRLGDAEKVFEL